MVLQQSGIKNMIHSGYLLESVKICNFKFIHTKEIFVAFERIVYVSFKLPSFNMLTDSKSSKIITFLSKALLVLLLLMYYNIVTF